MRKITYKSRRLWFLAAVFWMLLIFHFSDQKAVVSGKTSGRLTGRIAEGINEVFHLDWEKDTVEAFAEQLEHPVRKMAHMTEYAILAWILLGNCMQYPFFQKKCGLWAWLGASLYAATDEFHQLFIEGRSGELKDVLIDSMGACAGLLLAWAVICIVKKRQKRKKRKTDGKAFC